MAVPFSARSDRTRTALIVSMAVSAAALIGLKLGGNMSIGLGTVLALVFVPVAFANAPLGVAVWLGMLFNQWMPGINAAENAASGLLALVGVGLLAGSDGRARDELRRHARLIALVVAFGLWMTLTPLWSEASDLALQDVKRWLLAIYLLPLVIVIAASAADVRVVLAGFVLGAVLSVVVGFSEQNLHATTDSLAAAANKNARLQGGAGDPNYLAAALVPAVALAAALIPGQRSAWLKVLTAIVMVFLAAGLGATESRGGLIAGVAAIVASLVLMRGNRRYAAVFVCVLIGVSAAWYASSPKAVERVMSARTDEGSGRVDLWHAAWEIAKDHPVIGVGLNQFTIHKSRYAREVGEVKAADQLTDVPQVAHSVYLQLWAEAGIIGLVLFLLIVGASLWAAMRATGRFTAAGQRARAAMSGAIAVSIVSMCVASIFLSNGSDKRFWLLLGLGPAMLGVAERGARSASRRPSSIAWEAAERPVVGSVSLADIRMGDRRESLASRG